MAMGTRMAPSYANIFMGNLERKILEKVDKRPNVWWRYIHDVFAIWPHGEEYLIEFISQINNMHSTIQFPAEWSDGSIAFLDVKVTLDQGRIITDLFTKPTDTHQHLHRRNCHPGHCKSTIAYSQALRLQRICWEDDIYRKRAEELKHHLVKRGYEGVEVQRIDRATSVSRMEAPARSQNKNMERILLVVTYIIPSFYA